MIAHYAWFFELLFWMPPTLIAISWRETIKALACSYRNDTSIRSTDQTSFALQNLDPVGSTLAPIILILRHSYVFAWAKPTDLRPRFLKGGKTDVLIIVCLALLSNFVMAMGWAWTAKIGKTLLQTNPSIARILIISGQAGVQINILLIALHLLPLPPLDMSYVVRAYLPRYPRAIYTSLDPVGNLFICGLFFFNMGQAYIHPLYIALIDQLHLVLGF